MSDDVKIPDWLYVGAPVVEYTPEIWTGTGRAVFGEVERFTKTRVVLTSGEWYRLDGLIKRSQGAWTPSAHLVPPDDPQVAKVRAIHEARRVLYTTKAAVERWADEQSVSVAVDAMEKLGGWIEYQRSRDGAK